MTLLSLSPSDYHSYSSSSSSTHPSLLPSFLPSIYKEEIHRDLAKSLKKILIRSRRQKVKKGFTNNIPKTV
jgi:hypothetical protein